MKPNKVETGGGLLTGIKTVALYSKMLVFVFEKVFYFTL